MSFVTSLRTIHHCAVIHMELMLSAVNQNVHIKFGDYIFFTRTKTCARCQQEKLIVPSNKISLPSRRLMAVRQNQPFEDHRLN